MPSVPPAVAAARRFHTSRGESSAPPASLAAADVPAAASASSSSRSSTPTDDATTTIPARKKRAPSAKQLRYIDDVLADFKYFAKYPPGIWPQLECRVGQNDGTWKAMCAHFISKPGTPEATLLTKKWVRLKKELVSFYNITEVAFLNYTSREYKGTRLPWRYAVSEDMGHIVSRTDRHSHEIYIKLQIDLRNRPPPSAKKNTAKRK
ncbi:hypothetical protein HDU89_000800 [Geranomyces variabilis]|nr:hypothetical protein HDU89_000800 [Geranomyces variabilis]